MAAVAGASIPCHSGWVGGKTARPCSGLPHTGAPSASATATSGVDRAGLGHLVPGDDGELPGRGPTTMAASRSMSAATVRWSTGECGGTGASTSRSR